MRRKARGSPNHQSTWIEAPAGEPRTRADSLPTPRRTLRKVTAPARTSWAAARYRTAPILTGTTDCCHRHPSRPRRPAPWLHHYARDLLTPARCAELPPAAREAGQHWPRRRSFPSKSAALAGSDDAEARCAASRRCGGFAQSCGRCRSFDTGRSDPCARHQHGSCGRRFVRLVRFCAESSGDDSPIKPAPAIAQIVIALPWR